MKLFNSHDSSFFIAFAALLLISPVGCGGSTSPIFPAETNSSSASSSTSGGGNGGGGMGGHESGAGGSGGSDGSSSSSSGSGGSGGAGGSAPVVYPVPDWPTDVPWAHGLSGTGMQTAVDVAEQLGSYCLLVIRHGVLVSEHYWQGRDATSTDKSWSMAKSYSSALVGIAIDRGEIKSIDDSVSDYVPEWKGNNHEPITVRHIVSMTSGLKWDVFSDYVTFATLTSDQTKYAVNLTVADPPETKWVYNNAALQILERLIRNATGKTLEEYANLYLWSKIGMTAQWAKDQTGNPTAYANVLTTCRDHARLGYLYLHRGVWNGETVISSSWVTATITPSQTMNRGYGYLWWLNGETPAIDAMGQAWSGRMVPFAPADMFAVRGFGNQFVDVIPSLDMIVVRMGPDPFMGQFNLNQMIEDQHFGEHDKILKPILDAVVE